MCKISIHTNVQTTIITKKIRKKAYYFYLVIVGSTSFSSLCMCNIFMNINYNEINRFFKISFSVKTLPQTIILTLNHYMIVKLINTALSRELYRDFMCNDHMQVYSRDILQWCCRQPTA